jgi:hypothetical protein
MGTRTVLKGDKGEVALEILNYENPGALSLEDSNWLRAVLHVHAGPFSGAIEFGMTADELSLLYDQLAASTSTLSGRIRFATTEGNWELNVDFERSGTAIMSGVVTPRQAGGNALHYEFLSDPINLEAAVRDLQRMTKEYPVKTAL